MHFHSAECQTRNRKTPGVPKPKCLPSFCVCGKPALHLISRGSKTDVERICCFFLYFCTVSAPVFSFLLSRATIEFKRNVSKCHKTT